MPLGFGADGEELRGDATAAGGRKDGYVKLDIDDSASGRRSPVRSWLPIKISALQLTTWMRLHIAPFPSSRSLQSTYMGALDRTRRHRHPFLLTFDPELGRRVGRRQRQNGHCTKDQDADEGKEECAFCSCASRQHPTQAVKNEARKTNALLLRFGKQPLKSSIPLHSFRSNLKEGHGYVTSFPYGGLSGFLPLLLLCPTVCAELTSLANPPVLRSFA